ncbi:MAG: hypothetical protein H0U63_05355 [Burkholderiales bacterium]|nr:hypothetical protein [Burkholderiales bacterium]
MATSNLVQTGEEKPIVNRGHGTGALGPSDTSDSGSDMQGGPGLSGEPDIGLDTGTTSDPDGRGNTAGPDLGDADLDSDSDSGGTGERAAAGRDSSLPEGSDISVDRIGHIDDRLEDELPGDESSDTSISSGKSRR